MLLKDLAVKRPNSVQFSSVIRLLTSLNKEVFRIAMYFYSLADQIDSLLN